MLFIFKKKKLVFKGFQISKVSPNKTACKKRQKTPVVVQTSKEDKHSSAPVIGSKLGLGGSCECGACFIMTAQGEDNRKRCVN